MVCPVCNGEGKFKVKQIDEDGNYLGDVVIKCECKKKKSKADDGVVINADNNE